MSSVLIDTNMIIFRDSTRSTDKKAITDILASSGYFYDNEIKIGEELIDENLAKGAEKSGYYFIFVEYKGKILGFTCYGPIACTESSYDLFWIAVHRDFMFNGLGKKLIYKTEEYIKKAGGTRIYLETSGREMYKATREFYKKNGYTLEAQLKNFYGKNDDKLIYLKEII